MLNSSVFISQSAATATKKTTLTHLSILAMDLL